MTSRDFCYWLQGYFEIASLADSSTGQITTAQADMIKRHLSMVFIHEIDPSIDQGNPVKQGLLNQVHNGTTLLDRPEVARC
jgi:hypothetical protein